MLERATRCLNQRGRHSCSTKKNALHSRRMLHSAFWKHGAGDLDPTAWCATTLRALFEPEHTTDQDDHGCPAESVSQSPAPFLLDFLYSRRTRAYLRKISTACSASLLTRRQHSSDSRPTTRSFASGVAQQQVTSSASTSLPPERADALFRHPRTPRHTLEDSTPAFRELVEYVKVAQKGEYQDVWVRAWLLYSNLAPEERSLWIMTGMVDILSSSPRLLDASHLLHVFGAIPRQARTAAMYQTVIAAHVRLQQPEKVYAYGTQAITSFPQKESQVFLDIILTYFVKQRMWQVAFELWDAHANLLARNQDDLSPALSALNHLRDLQGLDLRMRELLSRLDQYPDLCETSKHKDFVAKLLQLMIERGEGLGLKKTTKAMLWLKEQGYLTQDLYDQVAVRMARRSNIPAQRVGYAFQMYMMGGRITGLKPSTALMRTLLKRAAEVGNPEVIDTLYRDWRTFQGTMLAKDTALFMKAFAMRGDVARVTEAFDGYIIKPSSRELMAKSQTKTRWLKLFYPLLHVRALLADPEGVEQELKRIKKTFGDYGIKPDITCYNILLHAHQRNDDLDGCLQCFSTILEADMRPDGYTFGTLMSVAADRGDIDTVERLEKASEEFGVPISQAMHDSHVLALLKSDQPLSALKYARELINAVGPGCVTRVWNQILSYHALGDRSKGLSETLELAQEMQKLEIPYDSSTFSAIIRAYVVNRKTAVGYRIIKQVMLKKQIPVSAFHFALIIEGFTRQRFLQRALQAHANMLRLKIKPDFSTRLALQKLHMLASSTTEAIGDQPRFDLPEELLEESYLEDFESQASKAPRLAEAHFNMLDAQPGAFFDFLLDLYGRSKAFDMIKLLLDRYFAQKKQQDRTSSRGTPLKFIKSLMELNYHQRDHEEVKKYWDLAKSTAIRLTSFAKQPEPIQRPPSARFVLARHLDIYMRSLAGRKKFPDLLESIQEYFAAGFDLDSSNWNLYVQLVAIGGYHVEAFTLCEKHLLPNFSGWRPDPKGRFWQTTGLRGKGLEHQGARGSFIRPGQLTFQYRTAVRMAAVVQKLRQSAPYSTKAQETLNRLQKVAPRTFEAVMELPVNENPIATHVLGRPGRIKGERRTMD